MLQEQRSVSAVASLRYASGNSAATASFFMRKIDRNQRIRIDIWRLVLNSFSFAENRESETTHHKISSLNRKSIFTTKRTGSIPDGLRSAFHCFIRNQIKQKAYLPNGKCWLFPSYHDQQSSNWGTGKFCYHFPSAMPRQTC